MANIIKDVSVTSVTITQKRNKFTGLSFDSNTDTISINYDIIALNASGVEIFKYGQDSKPIGSDRFGEAAVAAFLAAGKTLIKQELPNT